MTEQAALIRHVDTLITEMRTENRFSAADWTEIVRLLETLVPQWKQDGQIPFVIVPHLVDLSAFLAGGSRFFDEETALAAEDASIQLCTELLVPEEPAES